MKFVVQRISDRVDDISGSTNVSYTTRKTGTERTEWCGIQSPESEKVQKYRFNSRFQSFL